MDIEVQIDRLLNIKTNGRDDSNSNYVNFPYEPTPYSVLEILAMSGYIKKNDVLIDYGCGKGRVDLYISYQTKAYSIGIEYDERLYNAALLNKKNAIKSKKVEFVHINAKEYIPSDIDCAYFFNPFSVKVLDEVIKKIEIICKRDNKEVLLFFYYPSESYIKYLNSLSNVSLVDNLDCSYLYEKYDARECILIYKML